MQPSEWNRKRLGDAIRARRQELGNMKQSELAKRAGIDPSTLRNIEGTGRRADYTRLPDSTPAIERELKWGPGSFLSLLEDGDPILLPDEAAPAIDPAKLAAALESLRTQNDGDTDELTHIIARIFDADLPAETKHALLELHRARIAEAQRQTLRDLERAEQTYGMRGA